MISNFLKIIFITASILLVGCNADLQSKNDEDKPSVDTIEQKLNEMLPESVKLVSVEDTDITGYFEVNFEGIEPLYVSADGEYLISGDIYKITKEGLINKSDARRNYQRMSLLNSLDKKEFITFSPNITKHTVYIFRIVLIVPVEHYCMLKLIFICIANTFFYIATITKIFFVIINFYF